MRHPLKPHELTEEFLSSYALQTGFGHAVVCDGSLISSVNNQQRIVLDQNNRRYLEWWREKIGPAAHISEDWKTSPLSPQKPKYQPRLVISRWLAVRQLLILCRHCWWTHPEKWERSWEMTLALDEKIARKQGTLFFHAQGAHYVAA